MSTSNLSEFARTIHAHNVDVGWWDNDPCIYEKMQLISTEIAEATEGERKNLMDDKLPHRKMGEVELADALIRTLDLGERLGLSVEPEQYSYTAVSFEHDHANTPFTIGHMHLWLNKQVIRLYDSVLYKFDARQLEEIYTVLVSAIVAVSDSLGYDIMSAAREKHEFNKTRADHKRENRAAENGKKF